MKISAAQVVQTSEKAARVTQGEIVRKSALAQPAMKPAAGEQIEISREAELSYQSRDRTLFSADSQISSHQIEPTRTPQHHSATTMLENMIHATVSGAQAVSIIRSVGGGESTLLTGEVTVQLDEHVFYAQEQSAAMSFRGNIQTEDGRSIDFTMHLALSQSQRYEFNQSLNITRRPLTDPLVLNFGAESVKLSNSLFEFDLDADGDTESLRKLGAGSGFLALDKNADGVINDGSELFGSRTGNGFSELAYYDGDGNGWIDESDAVFSQLSVMVINEQGQQVLSSLKDVGVGAIYLGAADSPIDMMSKNGMLLGAIKRTGMFLTENGQVKTLQEIDMADQRASRQAVLEPVTIIRGERLPEDAQATGGQTFTNDAFFGMSVEALMAKFAQIREQQASFAKSFDESVDAPAVSFIKQLFARIDLATQQERGKSHRASAQYQAFDGKK
jgi:hypothetical protein